MCPAMEHHESDSDTETEVEEEYSLWVPDNNNTRRRVRPRALDADESSVQKKRKGVPVFPAPRSGSSSTRAVIDLTDDDAAPSFGRVDESSFNPLSLAMGQAKIVVPHSASHASRKKGNVDMELASVTSPPQKKVSISGVAQKYFPREDPQSSPDIPSSAVHVASSKYFPRDGVSVDEVQRKLKSWVQDGPSDKSQLSGPESVLALKAYTAQYLADRLDDTSLSTERKSAIAERNFHKLTYSSQATWLKKAAAAALVAFSHHLK